MSYEPTIIYNEEGVASVTERGRELGVTVEWVPNARNSGGTYADDGIDYPTRLVYHEIQGSANPSVIAEHSYPPHTWYKPQQRILYQTVSLSRSAFALYQDRNAPYRTNKARAIQVELEGYSDFVANEPNQWLENIAEDVLIPKCTWAHNYSPGGPIDLLNLPAPWRVPGSAYTDAPQRFEPTQWAKFNGVCAHANVPMGDDHWDTGAMDIWRISQHAALLIAGLLEEDKPPTQEIKPVPLYFLQVKNIANPYHGAYYPIFEGGMYRDDYGWDEINGLTVSMKIPVIVVDAPPSQDRKMP